MMYCKMTNVKGVGRPQSESVVAVAGQPSIRSRGVGAWRRRARHAAGSDEVHLTYQSRLSLISLASPRSIHASRSLLLACFLDWQVR